MYLKLLKADNKRYPVDMFNPAYPFNWKVEDFSLNAFGILGWYLIGEKVVNDSQPFPASNNNFLKLYE